MGMVVFLRTSGAITPPVSSTPMVCGATSSRSKSWRSEEDITSERMAADSNYTH